MGFPEEAVEPQVQSSDLVSLSLFLQYLDPWLHPKLLNMVSATHRLVRVTPTSLTV